MLAVLEVFILLEKIKLQELKRSKYGYRGWGSGMSPRGINRLLYTWAGIGADGALLG